MAWMPHLSWAAVACAVLSAAPAAQEREARRGLRPVQTAESILRHVEKFTGGPERLLAAGDLELAGVFQGPGHEVPYRALVRRAPFGYREEIQGRGAHPSVAVTDGDVAWSVGPEGRSVPLPSGTAVTAIENAFVLGGLYLLGEPWVVSMAADVAAEIEELDEEGEPTGRRIAADQLAMRTTAGTVLHLLVDPADGRLLGMEDRSSPLRRWIRLGGWEEREGVMLPSWFRRGHRGQPASTRTLRIHEVRARRRHDPGLFTGRPAPDLPPLAPAARLSVAPAGVPGSAYFVVDGVHLDGRGPFRAVLDTGAETPGMEPRMAAGLRLYPLSPGLTTAMYGQVPSYTYWVDVLGVGGLRFPQVHLKGITIPGMSVFPHGEQPPVLLGARGLWEASPVLDLARGRLLVRGAPAAPLEQAGLGRAVSIPLTRREKPGVLSFLTEVVVGERTVPAFLDTGYPLLLRLDVRALRRLGLPVEREHWLARGGMDYPFFGAGGEGAVDLLVRLERVELGPVVYERPYVQLTGLDRAGEEPGFPFEALLGAGALLPFARAALDPGPGAARLELAPGPGGRAAFTGGGRVRVPPPGRFLGLRLEPPRTGAWEEPQSLPRVAEVLPGGPADRAGLAAGDHLLSLDGEPLHGLAAGVLLPMFWIAEGAPARLVVVRPDGSRVDVVVE